MKTDSVDMSVQRLKKVHSISNSPLPNNQVLIQAVPAGKNTVFQPPASTPEAIKEEVKEEVTKEDLLHLEKVQNAPVNANRIIYSISTVFPFTILPNSLIIEETKINLIFWIFLGSKQIHSVDIKDVTNVFLETTPFFANIRIVSRTFTENEISMNTLRKNEATKAKDIIEGMRFLNNKKIDTSKLSNEQLRDVLQSVSRQTITKKFL